MNRQTVNILTILYIMAFVLAGGYYELSAAILSIGLLCFLLCQCRKGDLNYRFNDAVIAVVSISFFYCLSVLWATDRGMALWGSVKYLPVMLFGLSLMQVDGEKRTWMLEIIPEIAVAMTGITYVMSLIPALRGMVVVSGRLGGFFAYPNTYASFLLVAIVVWILRQQNVRIWEGIVLFFGMMQAQSRAVLVMTCVIVPVCLWIRKEKKWVIRIGICGMAGVAAAIAAGMLKGGVPAHAVGADASGGGTFWARILYAKDALPEVLSHPFGFGYLGYFFRQGTFQHGYYTVRWVHNDFLQLCLDVGWIPAILLVIAIVRSFRGHIPIMNKVVLLCLVGHMLFDFDMEFIAMYFVLLLCLNWDEMKPRRISVSPAVAALILAVVGCFCGYIGIVSAYTYQGASAKAARLYPWNTLAEAVLITQKDEVEELEKYADKILLQNSYAAIAWNAKAAVAYARGDFAAMITAKKEAIRISPYHMDTYAEYFAMLRQGRELYEQAGDTASAAVCEKEIAAIGDMIRNLQQNTDELTQKLGDQPDIVVPEGYADYMASEGMNEKTGGRK